MTGSKLVTLSVGGEEAAFDGVAYAKTLPGITGLDVWDPTNYCKQRGVTEGKIKFYREVELKHARLAMLASVGIIVGENYHPLFGGDIDVPSYLAFQQTPLQAFWPAVVFAIAIPEIFSVLSFEPVPGGKRWSIRSDHDSGNLGFDPLDLKPTDADELKEMQTKELTYGRFAMLGAAGMILQEVMTGSKLVTLSVGGEEAAFDGVAYAKTLPGITGLEVWDPMNYCKQRGVTEGKIKFYREVELKHARLAMLASVGIVVGENYHPLFGGDIDTPSYLAFQQTPLQTFWPAVVLAIAIPEIYSVLSFEPVPGGELWSISP